MTTVVTEILAAQSVPMQMVEQTGMERRMPMLTRRQGRRRQVEQEQQ
jgi:hypothetical protein